MCAVVGCTSAARRTRRSSSRCSAARGRSATPRGSSSPRSRAKRIPNDASSHAFTCRQRTPTSHGSPTTNSAIIANGVPTWPNTCSKPRASAWPSAFVVASPVSAVASVQLAVSTPTKPSQSRIEPGPARPPPPGSAALTSRQKRGMNQTAEKPNQPRTTVCMLRNRRRTGARRATPSSLTGRRRCFRERRAFSRRPRARPGGWRPPSGSPAGPSAARRAYLPSRRANVSVASASVMMTSCCGARICTPAFEMWPSAAR
ncbi:hypothetical protein DP59_5273 [Burkholderia pseudomallei]|nr:hypothetical protein DP59_5273 [Burkholderia pseudomallei]KGD51407.1 hypothetical protein DP43_5429 [Burkholderia pseudomallei]